MNYKVIPHQLKFKFKAGTSRGYYTTHDIFYILLENEGVIGVGEVAPLKDLSIDALPNIGDIIKEKLQQLSKVSNPKDINEVQQVLDDLGLEKYPAVRFGIETALLDIIGGGRKELFKNDFTLKERPIPINGLIWMGDKNFMLQQVKDKVDQGFSCIKMKIGAIDFEEECRILKYIRSHFSNTEIELRVDANGAFSPADAIAKLNLLSKFDIHSIEQPIKPNQWSEMSKLCEKSPIAIALDEELIGVEQHDAKVEMLSSLKPKYIILKPTLVGGLFKAKEWVQLAEKMNIGWWFTSALESNIGLNAIAQFTGEFDTEMPQGLGTGSLYENNLLSPLMVENGTIMYSQSDGWGDMDKL